MSILKLYKETNIYKKDAIENGISDAAKTASNYLSHDNTGIMVADLKDGEQTPSSATGRNVFIDNDSVDIRDGQSVLASFSEMVALGDKTSRHVEIDETGFQTKLNENSKLIFIGVINDPENNNYAEILERQKVTNITASGENFIGFSLNSSCVQLLDVKYGNTSILNLVTLFEDSDFIVKFTSSGSTYIGEYVTVRYYTNELTPCINFGLSNTAKSKYSIVFGNLNNVYASYAMAMGYQCTIYGEYSVAEGWETLTNGTASHAEGYHTIASGDNSHAEGDWTKATGIASHAEGNHTEAKGTGSHASGEGTIAAARYQTVVGKYNVEDIYSSYAFLVGNGTDANNRSNAFAVKWDGTPVSPAITYSPNDTFSVTQLNVSGVMTVTNTTVVLSLETDKYMDQVSTVTVTSLAGALRGVNGYIDDSRYDTNWITSAYTVTATKKSRKHVEIRITKPNSAAFTNATTDTPLSLYATMTLTFTT